MKEILDNGATTASFFSWGQAILLFVFSWGQAILLFVVVRLFLGSGNFVVRATSSACRDSFSGIPKRKQRQLRRASLAPGHKKWAELSLRPS
jgi:hypothetical protein